MGNSGILMTDELGKFSHVSKSTVLKDFWANRKFWCFEGAEYVPLLAFARLRSYTDFSQTDSEVPYQWAQIRTILFKVQMAESLLNLLIEKFCSAVAVIDDSDCSITYRDQPEGIRALLIDFDISCPRPRSHTA